MKTFTRSKAKLRPDEMIIGGDAPSGCENKERKAELLKIIHKVDKQLKDKKAK